jgi:transcriptional regulator with XRE-family HTH domain
MHACMRGVRVLARLEVVAQVGAEIRRLRLASGLTGEALAAELGWSQAKLSRIESGRLGVTIKDLNNVLDALGASESTRAELLGLVAGEEISAWLVRAGGPKRRQREVRDIEQRLRRYREHHPLLVPGQLQSRAYTMAMAAAAGLPDPGAIADARAVRQELLTGDAAPKYEALLDVRSLLRHPGGTDVMQEQVDYLLTRMEAPAITVRGVPESSNAGAMTLGAFIIYEFIEESSHPLVMLETQFVDVYLADPIDIAAYEGLWRGLNAEALSVKETRAWLVSLRDGKGK